MSDADLPVEDRPAVVELDRDEDEGEEHGEDQEADQPGDDVDEPLEHRVDARGLAALLEREQPRLAQAFDEQAPCQLLVDVGYGAHHQPAVVALHEALEEVGGEVLLGAEHDLVGLAAHGRGAQPAAGVHVGRVDRADDPVEAGHLLVDLGPDAFDRLRIGNQHDPAREDRPGEDPPIQQPPAEDGEARRAGPR